MIRRDQPRPSDDVLDLTAIALGAAISLVVTGVGLSLWFTLSPGPARDVPALPPAAIPTATVEAVPAAGADRLFGVVARMDGSEIRGYIRWNGREASLADLLPAVAPGGSALAGVRFGHIDRMEPTGASGIRATLRSGQVVDVDAAPVGPAGVGSSATDGAVHVEVTLADGSIESVPWRAVRSVEFSGDGRTFAPPSARLRGTVRTASGQSFTGYLLWHGSEGLATDRVGDEVEGTGGVPFAEVEAVHRDRPDALVVETTDGGAVSIRAEALARPGLGEILVADPFLGTVAVPWAAFRGLRLHEPDAEAPGRNAFDGGAPLLGAVVTRDGPTLSGPIRWDMDEDRTWQTLDGQDRGLRFSIELAHVASVRAFRQGAEVTLRDGRTFELGATNDVNWSNRGIQVGAGADAVVVPWKMFVSARFDAPSPEAFEPVAPAVLPPG